jgi:uncharacterized protein YecE (DUF72 family)
MQVHIGCSGWFYWHWKKLFYPENIPTHRWFQHYASVFKTVELNAPFYRWPQRSTVKAWKRQAPPEFRYSVKVNQRITHEKRMVRTAKLVKEFCSLSEILGPQLGCFLFQLPPSYRFTRARLSSIVKQLGPIASPPVSPWIAVEFRHKSWWRKAVYNAFTRAGIVFCSISGPRMPEELIRTADAVYLRFHGRTRWYRHDYSDAELSDWVKKLRTSGAREAWIYFNNDREGFALRNARQLQRLLERSEQN